MAKSKKSEIQTSNMHYDLVLSSMTLDVGESSGGADLEFMLRKIIEDGLTRFKIEVAVSGDQELAWPTDAATLLQIAEWFGDAAVFLEVEIKKSTKSGLPRGRR